MGKILVLIFSIVTLSGCASSEVISEAKGKKMLNAFFVSCKKPYYLTQDCSAMWGAKRKLDINGAHPKVAATEDGKIILVMEPHPIATASFTGFVLEMHDYSSTANNNMYYLVKDVLSSRNIQVEDVVPIASSGSVQGYFMFLNENGYEILKGYSINEDG